MIHEGVQLAADRLCQPGQVHSPANCAALTVNGDQLQQAGQYLRLSPASHRRRSHQRGVRLTGQRALHPAEFVIARRRQRIAARQPRGQLVKGKGKQR